MAFPTTNYVNGDTVQKLLVGSVPVNTDVIKLALYTDSLTGFDSNSAEGYLSGAWSTTNEVSGTGYTAGGETLPTVTAGPPSAGQLIVDSSAANQEWTTASFTARGGGLYSDTAPTKPLLACYNFGSDLTVTAGTFTVTFDTNNGLFFFTYEDVS